MYKLIIADDEPTELKFLRYVVSKYNLPFTICAEAQNGEELIKLVEKHQPQFLIVDIHMPLIDGLTAAEHIKKKYSFIKIYILTAYEDFEYAKKAIKVNVEDYLLKPVRPEQLVDTLKKGIQIILRERLEVNSTQKIKNRLEQIKPILKKELVYELVSGEETKVPGRYLRKELLHKENLQYSAVMEAYLWDKAGKLIEDETALLNFARKVEMQVDNSLFGIFPKGKVVILTRENPKVVRVELEKIIASYHKKGIFIGLGMAPITTAEGIDGTFQRVSRVSETALFWRKSGLFSPKNDMKKTNNPSEQLQIEKVYKYIVEQNIPAIQELLKNLFNLMTDSFYSSEKVIAVTSQLIAKLVGEFGEQIFSNTELNAINDKFVQGLENIETAQELERLIWIIIDEFAYKVVSQRKSTVEQSVNWAVGYINKNYQEELTLEKLAQMMFLSPSYLSRIFKKHMGEGFAGYLVKVRLENAQKFLMTGKYTVSEVSRKVGFNDPSYFSSVFKKHLHLQPKELIPVVKSQNIAN